MAEQRGSSMLFSLRGLMGGEAQRLEAEAQRRTCHEEIQAARVELQLYERIQASRRDAIRLALDERSRVVAQARAELELLEKRHAHERRVAEIVDRAQRRRERQLMVCSLVLALCTVATSLGLYFGKLRPDAQRLHRAYDELATAEHKRAEEAQRLLDRSERARRDAERALDRRRLDQGTSTRSAP
jgi:colicin import membrane protein